MPDQEERNEGARRGCLALERIEARGSGSGAERGDLVRAGPIDFVWAAPVDLFRAAPVELADTGAEMFGGFEDRYTA